MSLTEDEILRAVLDWRAAGRRVALCTVVDTWGAAPKPVGSHLIVDHDGEFLGSVSGGCVEGDVIAEAIDVIAAGNPRMVEFGIADDLAWKAGLTCGGRIKVYVERIDGVLADCLSRMISDRTVCRPTVLVTALDTSPPFVVGERGLGEHVAHPIARQIEDALRTGKSGLVEDGTRQWVLAALMPATRLVVIGAVHIAQALSSISKLAGLEMTVVDPRGAFATPARFPNTRLIAAWPEDAAANIGISRADAVAVVSHDPKIDDQGLRLALSAGCFYVGALGSRRSHARRLERLRAAGVAEQDLLRIHAPIGLDIGAEGPGEIAVSIVAEIISLRRTMSVDLASSEAA